MPTKPLETVLYRELSQVAASDIIEIASPLLQEVVNYSTHAFARCLGASIGEGHEDTSILTLYRHIIEMADSMEILVSKCCPNPANQLLRSAWEYMFRDRANAEELADRVAHYLGDSTEHLSHGRRIGIEQLAELEVNVPDLRQTPSLREAIWNLYQAIAWTLQDTNAFKIIESGHGTAYIRQVIVQQIKLPLGGPPLPQSPPDNKPKRRKPR